MKKAKTAENGIIPPGKLGAGHLARLLERYAPSDARLRVGPGIGEDAAVIDQGDTYLVLKTDPITFVDDSAAWYAVNINANDIVCTGAAPRWLLAAFLLPQGATTTGLVDGMFEQLNTAAAELGIAVCGGHVEITDAVTRPVVIGCMAGEMTKDRLIDKKQASPGNRIVLTKGIAVEAVSVIARTREEEVKERFGAAFLSRALDYIHEPGISVVPDAQCACGAGTVTALHDPTEGGLATALYELAAATGCGVRVERDAVPVLDDARVLCDAFGLDPMGAIASGALLAAVEAGSADAVVAALRAKRIDAAVIGELVGDDDVLWLDGGEWSPVPSFPRDEIVTLFAP